MLKKTLVFFGMFLALSLAVSPVLAETNGTNSVRGEGAKMTTTVDISAKIACVGAAVATREQSLGVAVNIHAQAVQAAYSARATALAAAYTKTTTAEVKTAVRAAWSLFNSSVKSANSAWRTARNSAWSAFRTSSKACRAPSGVSDSSNSGSEMSGQ